MRVIETRSFQFREFDSPADLRAASPNGYAILSHRWAKAEHEISFTQYQTFFHASGEGQVKSEHHPWLFGPPHVDYGIDVGIEKIGWLCYLARRNSIDFAWIDTCCLRREDVQEVEQSINNMFDWYRGATVCYTYLFDVEVLPRDTPHPVSQAYNEHNNAMMVNQVRDSIWFKRAWTLPELLASRSITFLDRHWNIIGEKADQSEQISLASGIDSRYLEADNFRTASLATKQGWIANTTAGVTEDKIYCMLGVFGIRMDIR